MLPGGRRGKLKDWVRWQIGADGPGPEYCENTCREIRRRRGDANAEDPCAKCPEPAVFTENVVAVDLFCACQTQWREGGLDYQALETTARLLEIPLDPALFRKIQVVEAELIKASSDRAKRQREEAEAEADRARGARGRAGR